ncbi:uncharacterized protein [Amphiura filiformis]|uniref:uncharacterized protein n=1 Tax=Amphiura filiformis TaxID=82378 RepID=UPI003B21FA8F
MAANGVEITKPVYLKNRDAVQLEEKNLTHKEIYAALLRSLPGNTTIHGIQRIRGLWNLYLDREDRILLIKRGINIRAFEKLKCTVRLVAKQRLRINNQLTHTFSGVRVVNIDMPKNPLPKEIMVGSFQASLSYRGQPQVGKFERACSNCLQKGHNRRDCKELVTCNKCKQPGHIRRDCPTNASHMHEKHNNKDNDNSVKQKHDVSNDTFLEYPRLHCRPDIKERALESNKGTIFEGSQIYDLEIAQHKFFGYPETLQDSRITQCSNKRAKSPQTKRATSPNHPKHTKSQTSSQPKHKSPSQANHAQSIKRANLRT